MTRQDYFLVTLAISGMATAAYVFWPHNITSAAEKAARTAPQIVTTARATQQSLPITLTSNGYVVALKQVDVHPQVQNVVQHVHVREGQEVRRGELLFTLDARNDQASLAKATADMASNRANLADAEIALQRNQELLAKHFVSPAAVDSARHKVDALRAAWQSSAAAVQSNQVTLGYNEIRASIRGRIGAISAHPGSLVQPSGAALLTIAQLDPIGVSFTLPERDLITLRTTYPKGNAPVTAQRDAQTALTGHLIFIDNSVDTQSGAIRLKARFDNPQHLLWPGMFINVRLLLRTLENAVVIPAQALVTGPVDHLVYVVQPDHTVLAQTVSVLAISEGQAAVSGVAPGVSVVVEGNQNLRPGMVVKELTKDMHNDAAPAIAHTIKKRTK